MFKIVCTLYVILASLDLTTTAIAGIEREANPIGVWLWANYGFVSLIVGKVVTLIAFVSAWNFFARVWEGKMRTTFHTLTGTAVILPHALVVIWNVFCLTA